MAGCCAKDAGGEQGVVTAGTTDRTDHKPRTVVGLPGGFVPPACPSCPIQGHETDINGHQR